MGLLLPYLLWDPQGYKARRPFQHAEFSRNLADPMKPTSTTATNKGAKVVSVRHFPSAASSFTVWTSSPKLKQPLAHRKSRLCHKESPETQASDYPLALHPHF